MERSRALRWMEKKRKLIEPSNENDDSGDDDDLSISQK